MHITKSGLPSVKSGIPINSTPYWTDQVGRFPAGDYAIEYDSRGRIIKDETRGIESIRYQPFDNLPYKIEMTNGSSTTSNYFTNGKLHSRTHSTPTIQTITHITASGDTIVKSRPSIQTTRTEYFGNFERSGDNYRYNTPQGYYDLSNNQHYWFQRDRLGSTVIVYDSAANMLQTTAYYPSGTPHQLQSSSVSTKVDALTDQLHIGNHWLSHAGLNLYDNTARLHDPLLMHFGAPDPLYSDYPGNSPWSHCGANPVMFLDLDGCMPTAYEGACIAENIYDGKIGDVVEGGWKLHEIYTNDDSKSFKAGLYIRTDDKGVKEYALAFAGTFNKEGVYEDGLQYYGKSKDMKYAIERGIKVSEKTDKAELTIIGHSKGGTEGAGVALVTNRPALLYNPANLNHTPIKKYENAGQNKNAIKSYIAEHEFVNTIGRVFTSSNIYVPGKKQYIDIPQKRNIFIREFDNHKIKNLKKAIYELQKK